MKLDSLRTDLYETWYVSIFRKSVRKFKFHSNLTRITGTLHEDVSAFMSTRWIRLRMINIQTKTCTENQNICIL